MEETLTWYSLTLDSLAPGLVQLLGLVVATKLAVLGLRWIARR